MLHFGKGGSRHLRLPSEPQLLLEHSTVGWSENTALLTALKTQHCWLL